MTSVEGNKLDITKANNSEDLMYILFNLKNKGYYRILCQEYIYFDYEFVCCGSCSSDSAFLISKNIRTWPIVGGTNSFFKAIADPQIEKVCMSILKALQDEGFKGLFDIEMFCSGDKILVNEFNWRNTGNSFFSHGTGVHYAVIWYYSMIGRKDLASNINHCCKDSEQYAMNEATDLRHVFFSGISFIEWLKDYKKTQSFALWYRGDLKPTFIQYMHLVKVLICGKKIN